MWFGAWVQELVWGETAFSLTCLARHYQRGMLALGGATPNPSGWWSVLTMMRSLGILKPMWIITVWTEWMMKHFTSMYDGSTSDLKALENEVLHQT